MPEPQTTPVTGLPPQPTTEPAAQPTPEGQPNNAEILQAMQQTMATLAESQQTLNTTAQQIMQNQQSPQQPTYLEQLERGQAQQQPTSWDEMDNAQLAQALSGQHRQEMAQLANQYGQMLEAIAPDHPIWQMRDPISGIMAQGVPFKDAYAKVKALTDSKAQETSDQSVEERVKAEVDTKLAAIDAERRARRAGVADKPGAGAAPQAKLSPTERFDQMWDDHVVDGKPLPVETTRGL